MGTLVHLTKHDGDGLESTTGTVLRHSGTVLHQSRYVWYYHT